MRFRSSGELPPLGWPGWVLAAATVGLFVLVVVLVWP